MLKSIQPTEQKEKARLKELYRYDILDSRNEPSFDLIAQMASETIGTPIALVTIIDAERQWFKAAIGIDVKETPRELAVCAHTICYDDYFEVSDFREDERFSNNPMLTAQGLRAYLGVPVFTRAGHPLGSLCVIDNKPRTFTDGEKRFLKQLSCLAADELELRQTESKLQRALIDVEKFEAAKRQFLALISHECRTPLNAIKGALDILHNNHPDAEQSRFIDIASDAADRLSQMVEDVIMAARVEYNAIEIKREWFDPSSLGWSVVQNFRQKVAEKDIAIDLHCAPSLPETILADRLKLLQIMNHVLSNAVKFTDEGRIDITIDMQRENYLCIEVTDTGKGFPDHNSKTLFQPFTQNENYLNRTHEGLGLGLGICSRLCDKMGGRMMAKALPGVGSRIYFEVPVNADIADKGKSDFVPLSLTDLVKRH